MTTVFDQTTLDALHPFSFVAQRAGVITAVGRSLKKIISDLRCEISFLDIFVVEQPTLGVTGTAPHDLIGELVVLSPRTSIALKLRGQVVPLNTETDAFLFALTPVFTDVSQVSSLGIEFADFSVGDPVFDFLLFIQAQRIARKRLEVTNEKLLWEYKVSKLLHELTLQTYDLNDAERAYSVVITAVCDALQWEMGHVFVLTGGKQPALRSAGRWYLSDATRYTSFRHITESMQFIRGEGLPGRAWERGSVVWVPNVKRDPQFSRGASLPESSTVTGVGVPVLVEGQLVAVLEFFTERPPLNQENLARFFELLGLLLASVITRQRIAQREKEQLAALVSASKMAALGEIAAGVAHEINNPVSSISLTSHLVSTLSKAGSLDADAVQTHTSRIKVCVQRIATIVSELRDFSRDSSSDPFVSVRVGKIVDETLDLCSARFASKGIKLELGVFPSEWTIDCRASQISQVLLNLLNNAFDAVVGLGTRWVRLDGRELDNAIEISVTDSGDKIDEEVMEKMMIPFFTTKPPGMGTGLGLSISSNIITDHGGELRLDSTSANTRFTVRLLKRHPQRTAHGSSETLTSTV